MIVHEKAKHHRERFTTWKELERNLSDKTGIIDAEFHVQIEKKQKWSEILKRILHGIKYLAEQNLALPGHRESLEADNDANVGNFFGLMKFLAVFDSVLREHLGFIESYPHSTSYLSPGVKTERDNLSHRQTIERYKRHRNSLDLSLSLSLVLFEHRP